MHLLQLKKPTASLPPHEVNRSLSLLVTKNTLADAVVSRHYARAEVVLKFLILKSFHKIKQALSTSMQCNWSIY